MDSIEKDLKQLFVTALELALSVHCTQVDKAGAPYILHPITVAARLAPNLKAQIVGILHDVIEDSRDQENPVTERSLTLLGFPDDVVAGVVAVTRNEDEDYETFIRRCGTNHLGTLVKLEDLNHNMDLRRFPTQQLRVAAAVARNAKYRDAYAHLRVHGTFV